MSRRPNLTIECECPPIPDRQFDWAVYDDPEGVVGRGETEEAATADFWEQWELKELEREDVRMRLLDAQSRKGMDYDA